MTLIKEHADCETLWMDTTYCQDYRYNESIMIAFSTAEESDNGAPYLSIVLFGTNKGGKTPMFGQIFPNMEEVDLIIEALQKAKQKALGE